jgi:hypothetical protein
VAQPDSTVSVSHQGESVFLQGEEGWRQMRSPVGSFSTDPPAEKGHATEQEGQINWESESDIDA